MRVRLALIVAAVIGSAAAQAQTPPAQNLTPEQKAYVSKISAILHDLHPRMGDVKLSEAAASLHLGDSYYFVSPAESKRILVDAWGNSPDAGDGVLGMVFRKGSTFVDADAWAAVITYEPQGYVSDDDAKSADYGKILTDAQGTEGDLNEERKNQGLDPIHIVGWAQPPYYDKKHHTLIWARNIRFGNQSDDTLNYDLRALGRKGVLSMNIISTMSQLDGVRQAAGGLQNVASFDAGSRYSDYQSGVDKKAEYGVAGLVAAGVGVAVAQKLGLIGLALLFLKKFAIIAIAAAGGFFAWVRRFFSRNTQVPPPETS
jgi:uncharacterized membrane-anchored protein